MTETRDEHRFGVLLQTLSDYQGAVSSTAPGWDDWTVAQRAQYAILGLMTEAGELFNAMKVKPWVAGNDGPVFGSDRVETAKEFADVLAFLGMLTHVLDGVGITPQHLGQVYVQKAETNRRRFGGEPNYGRDPKAVPCCANSAAHWPGRRERE